MKVVATIQARMTSTRLPGKMLLPLADATVMQWVYRRTCLIAGVDEVVVATTVAPADDPLATHCAQNGMPVIRGSAEDVLDRYHLVATTRKADVIVRITGDCPLLDPVESAKVLTLFQQTPGCDYASNCNPPRLPDGLDTEVVSAAALAQVWRKIPDPVAREHVTWYVWNHPERFHLAAVEYAEDVSHHRWTLDNPEDYQLLGAIAGELRRRGQFGHLHEVLALLRDHPAWLVVNQHLQRNEGLQRSLQRQRGISPPGL